MAWLLVVIYTPDGKYTEAFEDIELALEGSEYSLDRQGTKDNEGITTIPVASEDEGDRLMNIGEMILPSGYKMEIPSY
jgi:hypothetical protein